MPLIAVLACLVSLVFSTACATHTPPWQARVVSGCTGSLGDPRLDQERTYLAALLALSARQYAILHSEFPTLIEAESRSDYHPEIFHTRWVLRVRADGSLEIDAPENARETHERTRQWYDKLSQTVARFQCRDLPWLRWEAQNRGLLAVGAGLAEVPVGEASAGGESPSALSAQPATDLPPSTLDRAAFQRETDALRARRRELKLWHAVGWSGAGAGMLGAGLSLGGQGLAQHYACKSDEPSCVSKTYARVLGYTGLGFGVAGGVVLSVALPILLQRLPRYRALSRELRARKEPELSLGVGAADTPFALTLSGRF